MRNAAEWERSRHQPQVVRSLNATMRAHSADAALVLMVLPAADEQPPHHNGGDGYLEALRCLTAGLPPTVLCQSGGDAIITTEI